MTAHPKSKKYPPKIKVIIDILVAQGFFLREKDIVNVALFDYFTQKGFFEKLMRAEKK